MKEQDFNKIAKYEKAIKEKYGPEAIQNPKKNWDKEKEEAYISDLKEFYKDKQEERRAKQEEGFEVLCKRGKADLPRNCPVCHAFSTSNRDDLYMYKFQCCFQCYIQYVEDREERWKTGWRPNE